MAAKVSRVAIDELKKSPARISINRTGPVGRHLLYIVNQVKPTDQNNPDHNGAD